jgi:hypothetical protein
MSLTLNIPHQKTPDHGNISNRASVQTSRETLGSKPPSNQNLNSIPEIENPSASAPKPTHLANLSFEPSDRNTKSFFLKKNVSIVNNLTVQEPSRSMKRVTSVSNNLYPTKRELPSKKASANNQEDGP